MLPRRPCPRLLGREVAQRVLAPDNRCHVLGTFGNLQIAEFAVKNTQLAGTSIGAARNNFA
jgi:hypothetical protein